MTTTTTIQAQNDHFYLDEKKRQEESQSSLSSSKMVKGEVKWCPTFCPASITAVENGSIKQKCIIIIIIIGNVALLLLLELKGMRKRGHMNYCITRARLDCNVAHTNDAIFMIRKLNRWENLLRQLETNTTISTTAWTERRQRKCFVLGTKDQLITRTVQNANRPLRQGWKTWSWYARYVVGVVE